MDPLVLAAWSFPVLLLLIFLRVPIGLSMLVLGLLGSWQVYGNAAAAAQPDEDHGLRHSSRRHRCRSFRCFC